MLMVRLSKTVAVAPEHGMRKGREFPVLRMAEKKERDTPLYFVMGDAGEEVGLLWHEIESVFEGPLDEKEE